MNSVSLLPCPFCGGRALPDTEKGVTIVGCFRDGCADAFFSGGDRATVFAAWNTRAAPPVPALGGWRTMESAPKDGTEFLAYRSDQGVFTCRFAWLGEFIGDDDATPYDEGFSCWFHDRWGWLENELVPTHWMPLPRAPGDRPAALGEEPVAWQLKDAEEGWVDFNPAPAQKNPVWWAQHGWEVRALYAHPAPGEARPSVEEVAGMIVDATGAGTLGLTQEASMEAARPVAQAIIDRFSGRAAG